MNISTWLRSATKQLKDIGIASARLDAELILVNTLRKNRTYLHAHLDEEIDPRRVDIANARLDLRLDRVPLAYILGYKEFYGRNFVVSPAVLVPRPESEDVVSLFLQLTMDEISPKTLIDVGTGSGCLGITIALERPNIAVILSDISKRALQIAEKNADNLAANVKTQRQSLFNGQIEPVDYIIANLPYVDARWKTSPELRYEPSEALFADNGGLKLIYELIAQAPRHLPKKGLLVLEADPEQHPAVIEYAAKYGFTHAKTLGYALALRFIGVQN